MLHGTVVVIFTLMLSTVLGSSDGNFRIGAFNVQVFGRTKASKPEVMSVLSEIVQRYDIILIQEIRDISETAIYKLVNQTNILGPRTYDIKLSNRLGRTSSKEQYAFLFRNDTGSIHVVATHHYPDPDDKFEREPYAVKFSSQDTSVRDFVLAGVHVDPDVAMEEIALLHDVYGYLSTHWDTDNVFIMGDFNADCTYVNDAAFNQLEIRGPFYRWLIGDEADTTTKSTNCAYDRIVTRATFTDVVPDSPQVFRYDIEYGLDSDQTVAVSDHYPVEFELEPSAKYFYIGAFNVQVFGPTKASKAHVMDILAQIVQRYDIILIQEVRDSEGQVMFDLLEVVNTKGPSTYDMRMSMRLGRTTKEQYAFLFRNNTGTLSVTGTYQYPDDADYFNREPYAVRFSLQNTVGIQDFVLAGFRADPTDAVAEIKHLEDVNDALQVQFGTDNIIIMGDLHADGSSVSQTSLNSFDRVNYTWLIGDDVDTTTKSSHYAYDRMILTGDEFRSSIVPEKNRRLQVR